MREIGIGKLLAALSLLSAVGVGAGLGTRAGNGGGVEAGCANFECEGGVFCVENDEGGTYCHREHNANSCKTKACEVE
jgi:hypothetical protein